MKFKDTTAYNCRYGENAEVIWRDWDIIWENSNDDYQGSASFIAIKDDSFSFYSWSYGSCSGCDGWESDGLSSNEIEEEMRRDAIWFNDISVIPKFIEKFKNIVKEGNFHWGFEHNSLVEVLEKEFKDNPEIKFLIDESILRRL